MMDQVVYYQNTGTAQSPILQYRGPVTVSGTPGNLAMLGSSSPFYPFNGNRATITAADLDGNGQTEIVASDQHNLLDNTTIWGVAGTAGRTGSPWSGPTARFSTTGCG